jgi:hypothetical protein
MSKRAGTFISAVGVKEGQNTAKQCRESDQEVADNNPGFGSREGGMMMELTGDG